MVMDVPSYKMKPTVEGNVKEVDMVRYGEGESAFFA